jgi:Methyltransferase domain
MNWKFKAVVAGVSSVAPMGPHFYRFLQKRFGRLDLSSHTRLVNQLEMAQWLAPYGGVAGKTLFEVGTGHISWIPIGCYLSGAEKVFTYDLFPRLDIHLVKKALAWITANRDAVASMYPHAGDRLDVLVRMRSDPQGFLKAANIVYKSPADAAASGLPEQSVDVHFSFSTFEHIPQDSITAIMREARRILRSSGVAIHFIDPSDHFQHHDSSITKINFLRYSDRMWRLIGGNQFAYCNRLRASDYIRILCDTGFEIRRQYVEVDQPSLMALRNGFRIHKSFSHYDEEDMCSIKSYLLASIA